MKGRTDAGQIVPALRCQRKRTILSHEQLQPELPLQPLDLMADRGLGDVQLGGGLRETEMPRRGLVGAQSVQRRQAGQSNLLCMSFYHLIAFAMSFVEGAHAADIKS